MFFLHRMTNAVTMMYNEADELTACHFIRPSTYWKRPSERTAEPESKEDTPIISSPQTETEGIAQNEPS